MGDKGKDISGNFLQASAEGSIDAVDHIPSCVVIEILRNGNIAYCLLYTSPSPRDQRGSRMPSSA